MYYSCRSCHYNTKDDTVSMTLRPSNVTPGYNVRGRGPLPDFAEHVYSGDIHITPDNKTRLARIYRDVKEATGIWSSPENLWNEEVSKHNKGEFVRQFCALVRSR